MRHVLGKQAYKLSNGDYGILGTTRLTSINGVTRPNLKRATDEMRNAPREAWLLCEAMNTRKGSKENAIVTSKCRFLLFKNRMLVILYTNLLADTPRNPE